MSEKIAVAIIGYGNIGKYVLEAVESAPDMQIAGIVRRDASVVPLALKPYRVVASVSDLEGVADVAIVCTPSRNMERFARECLALGIYTVDSFDIHSRIGAFRAALHQTAKEHGVVAIVSAGWDPGSDSVIRALLEAMAPRGITHTNFGPGMSMGHTVAVKAVEGVKNALAMTIPTGGGVHRRMVYVELKDGYDFHTVARAIEEDDYFAHDETHVFRVEDVETLKDMGHGVSLERKGVSGKTQNQRFRFDMRINNPALTAQVLVAAARASLKQQPGAYTLIEIPPVDLLPGTRETWVERIV